MRRVLYILYTDDDENITNHLLIGYSTIRRVISSWTKVARDAEASQRGLAEEKQQQTILQQQHAEANPAATNRGEAVTSGGAAAAATSGGATDDDDRLRGDDKGQRIEGRADAG